MSFFAQLSIQSILLFFIILTAVNIILVFAIYMTDRKFVSIFWLLMANIFQISAIIMIYHGGLVRSFYHIPFSTFLAFMQVLSWVFALLAIMCIKPKLIYYLIPIAIGQAYTVANFYFMTNVAYIRAAASLVMGLTVVIGICQIRFSSTHIRQNQKVINGVLLFVSFYYFFRAVYRLTQILAIESIFDQEGSVALFVIISLSINVAMLVLILFLHFSDMVVRINDLYHHDPLTNLLSRNWFFYLFDMKLNELKRIARPMCVVLIDIDDFKQVNDTYGHKVGDQVLRELSYYLRKEVRETDIIGRYGGEEITLLFDYEGAEAMETVLQRLKDGLKEEVFSTEEIRITLSCGAYCFDQLTAAKSRELVSEADSLMYRVKESGKNDFMVYDACGE